MILLGGITAASAVIAAVVCGGTGAYESLQWLWLLPAAFLGSFLALVVLAFLFLWLMSALVDREKPQETDSKFYRRVIALYIDALIRAARVRVHARGLENVPQAGRFLLVCNHLSIVDPIILLGCFPKSQLAFISKRENDSMFLVGKLMRRILCQPINRENDREALKTILKCIQLIKEDQVSIAVFPEGGIRGDDKLHHFRSGVFKIAQKTKVPVVVCTLQNTQTVLSNLRRLKPSQVRLHLLAVIPPEEYEGMTTVQLGERIHSIMADDLGPDLVAEK